MNEIPQEFLDLLSPETQAVAYLATLMKDGTPQLTPVWFSWDGSHFLVNSARGRTKVRNVRECPSIALLVADPKTTLRYIQVRGKVVDVTEVGADEHINRLSIQYDGVPWTKVPGQVRVILKILPDHITTRNE